MPSATTVQSSVGSNTAVHLARVMPLTVTISVGDVVHLKPLGQHIIILGSAKAAFDLLDKRSAIYSSRPESGMAPLYVLVPLTYGVSAVVISLGHIAQRGMGLELWAFPVRPAVAPLQARVLGALPHGCGGEA